MSKASMRERLRYRFDNTMSRGTPALIGLLGLASLALTVVVAGLVLLLDPVDQTHPGNVVWKTLMRALDSGAVADDYGNSRPIFLTLMIVMTLGGIFIVSGLVGVLSNGLNDKLTELRKGRSRVVERGHTVVLGWSEQIYTIVTELVQANEGEHACVAILANRDKVEMEDELRARLGGTGKVKVVCRTGDPTEPSDLEIARLDQAGVILVPAPSGADADIHLIKTLLALRQRGWGTRRPSVVAVLTDSRNLPAARLAGGDRTEIIDSEDLTARLLVQSRRQPGLSIVCTELLNFAGDEIYMRTEPTLAGKVYSEALRGYETATVMGLRNAAGAVLINPSGDTVLGPADELVVLAASQSKVRLATAPVPVVEAAISSSTAQPTPAERTLMLGWNGRGPTIVQILDPYLPAGSQVQIAGLHVNGDTAAGLGQLQNLTVTVTPCDPTDRRALEALELSRFQHVIVLADDGVSRHHADSHALVTLLHLRDMKERHGDSYAIVSELNDDANRRLAQVTRADDFVVGQKLISLLLAQLSKNEHLSGVFAELFDAAGSEIYLKPADEYLVPGVEANFATVIEAACRRGQTAIGYRLQSQAETSPAYGVVLNPAKAQPLTLGPADRIVVLATS